MQGSNCCDKFWRCTRCCNDAASFLIKAFSQAGFLRGNFALSCRLFFSEALEPGQDLVATKMRFNAQIIISDLYLAIVYREAWSQVRFCIGINACYCS